LKPAKVNITTPSVWTTVVNTMSESPKLQSAMSREIRICPSSRRSQRGERV
jgi:hypothetical protein